MEGKLGLDEQVYLGFLYKHCTYNCDLVFGPGLFFFERT